MLIYVETRLIHCHTNWLKKIYESAEMIDFERQSKEWRKTGIDNFFFIMENNSTDLKVERLKRHERENSYKYREHNTRIKNDSVTNIVDTQSKVN